MIEDKLERVGGGGVIHTKVNFVLVEVSQYQSWN